MYERFSERARQVMVLANQEAQRFNHEYIGTEHILLGLIKEGSGTAAKVLKSLGLELVKIRLEVEKLVQSGPDMVTMGRLPQTPRTKKVIEYAMEEVRDLNHNHIGTEHILLGLLREEEGVAAQVLTNLELNLDVVRSETFKLIGLTPPPKPVAKKASTFTTLIKRLIGHSPDSTSAIAPRISRNLFGKSSLIAVDIGNSQLKLGQFPDNDTPTPSVLSEPTSTLDLPIVHKSGLFDFDMLASWCEKHLAREARWVVGTVHRSAAELLDALISNWAKQSDLNWRVRRLTYADMPLAIRVDEPARVGIDRLLAAVAANRLRAPDRATIVVDLGTAITVDLVEANGAFAGGAILPGMGMAGRALADQTDALPHVVLEHSASPPSPVGKSTKAAIEAGLYWGAVGAVGELVSQISKTLPSQPDIFITGGAGRTMADSIQGDGRVQYVPHLVLSGIALVDKHVAGGQAAS